MSQDSESHRFLPSQKGRVCSGSVGGGAPTEKLSLPPDRIIVQLQQANPVPQLGLGRIFLDSVSHERTVTGLLRRNSRSGHSTPNGTPGLHALDLS